MKTWQSAVYLLAVGGTLAGTFCYTLCDSFKDIVPGDPFAVVLAPMALIVSAAVAILAAAGVALVLGDAFGGN